jgi:CTP synthase
MTLLDRLLIPQLLNSATKDKMSMFCHVTQEQVFGIHDLTSVYHVPLLLQSQGIIEFLTRWLELKNVSVSDGMKGKGWFLTKRWKEMTSG